MSTIWARHYFEEWQRRAGDPNLPHWLRVASAAYGAHDDAGHARFKRGDLALILGSVDDDGLVRPYRNLGRAINEAVAYRWLAEGSYWGCLVVPAHVARSGDLSKRPAPCPLYQRHKAEADKQAKTPALVVVRSA